MPQQGSAPGTLNTRDWLNTLKHTLFVTLASLLAPLAQGAPFDVQQLKVSATTAGAAAVLTLASRFLQDNGQ